MKTFCLTDNRVNISFFVCYLYMNSIRCLQNIKLHDTTVVM